MSAAKVLWLIRVEGLDARFRQALEAAGFAPLTAEVGPRALVTEWSDEKQARRAAAFLNPIPGVQRVDVFRDEEEGVWCADATLDL